MERPIYVTEVAEREPKYNAGLMVTLDLWHDKGASEWWKQFSKKTSFTFKSRCFFGKEGERLFHQLQEAIKKRDAEGVRNILPKMNIYCQTNYEDLKSIQKWAHKAIQMPGDIGGPRKKEVREFLTSQASGRVLETMCGFNSYFDDSLNITEVVALDFCKEMLERYAYPKRIKILYDLEQVVKGKQMNFFADGSFQTVGCWGSNYLSRQKPVFTEFRRILSESGKLLILENIFEGYSDLIKRHFNPEKCAKSMRESGFDVKIQPLPWLKSTWVLGDYYLVQGIK
ncbi:MAG: hypothetical protein KJ623_01995 [Nanoarchaeota archaeon]|nr:hypothetical protein [Nanoarchaeota archaeon]MBU0963386.1 hypothetical protein [Nanoarchaeota archaeon]